MLKTFSGRAPSQNEFELQSFIALLRARNVTRYLEIGARHGDTFHEVMINLPAGSYGVAVDLPGGYWGKASSVSSLHAAVEDLRQRGYVIDVVLGDSTTQKVIDYVFEAAPYDAVLIDGDHRYAGVKSDWENYASFAELVAFHDIVGDGQREKVHNSLVEVPRLWEEIKAQHQAVSGGVEVGEIIEFIAEGSAMGIGVWISP